VLLEVVLSEVMAVMALLQQSQVLRLQEQAEAVVLQMDLILLVLVVLVVAEMELMQLVQLQILADNQQYQMEMIILEAAAVHHGDIMMVQLMDNQETEVLVLLFFVIKQLKIREKNIYDTICRNK
jgi:hypothetical protein